MKSFFAKALISVINLSIISFSVIFTQVPVLGGEPEYMKLDYGDSSAFEVKGYWDTSGVFIATDIEVLPQPRRPKLRGSIQKIDLDDETVTVYGLEIKIKEDTEFTDTGKDEFSLNDLKIGQHVEISCKVDKDDREWEARKIKIRGIKKSEKIKGTITGYSIDGQPPDTLEIHGLLIILNKQTDADDPAGSSGSIEKELFDDLLYAGIGNAEHVRAINSHFFVAADYRQNLRTETEYDLSRNFSSDYGNTEPEIRLEANGFFSKTIQAFSQVRIRKKYLFNNDRLNPPSEDPDLQITQIFILTRDLGTDGLAVQIGRQDFDEPREWLFDEYLDAARIYYYGSQPIVVEVAYIKAVEPIKDKFKTWTDYFGQVRWYFNKDNYLRSFILLRKDSDLSRGRKPVYYGLSYYGQVSDYIKPWLETAILRGEDKGENIRATAFDIGATITLTAIKFSPSVSLSYAYGSGDKNSGDQISNEFRQTDYEDNVDKINGIGGISYYGELLDPELSNLKIFTSGFGIRPSNRSSFEVVYHSYKQDFPNDKIRGDLIDPPARPNGIDHDIGQEFDFIFSLTKLWGRITVSWIYSIFKPGEAFAPYQENASLNRVNLKIDM